MPNFKRRELDLFEKVPALGTLDLKGKGNEIFNCIYEIHEGIFVGYLL